MRVSRPVLWTSTLLFLAGLVPFLWKAVVLDMPILPARASKVWRVELQVGARGNGGPGSVTLRLPKTDSSQIILDEQVESGSLDYVEQDDPDGSRAAYWQGRIGDLETLSYTFRVHLREGAIDSGEPPPESPKQRGRPAPVPRQISSVLTQLRVYPDDDRDSIIASLFGFVAHDVETAEGSSDDDLLTLASREGSRLGKARLLVSLLRAAGVEARLTLGLDVSAPRADRLLPFVEAMGDTEWVALHPSGAEGLPRHLVVLARGSRPLVTVFGAESWNLQTDVLHETLGPNELVSFMTPPGAFWRALSLYRLPIHSQESLKVLLVLPLAALVAAIVRNIIGIRTFGTFMPVLIALSLREMNLLAGIALVSGVIATVTVGRVMLDKLRLLFVPRLCLLLCLVVLSLTVLGQVGHEIGGRDMLKGVLLPIVILAMLSERIVVTGIEEGPKSTSKLLLGSLSIAACAYPLFHSEFVAQLMFGFPELIFCTMGVLVLIGGYTGYRLSELWRFRSLGQDATESAP